MSTTLDLPVPSRALAIAAHPDDVEFNCGATFAKWSAAGCVVNHLICTDGSKGSWDPTVDQSWLVSTRVEEQRRAADALGSTGEVVHLGIVDGELSVTRELTGQIAYWIRTLRPDVVLAHDPWRRWRLHPDHRAAGFLACDAVVAARDPLFFPEHDVKPHRPHTVLLFESEEPNHFEDVEGYGDVKVSALLAHKSQFETTMYITDDPEGQAAMFRHRIFDELAQFGRDARTRYAEGFRSIDAR